MIRVLTTRVKILMFVMLGTTVVLLSVRLAFLGLILPTPWVDTDAIHLYHVIHDFQNFPLDTVAIEKEDVWPKTQANLSLFKYFCRERKKAYLEFTSRLDFLRSQPQEMEIIRRETELLNTFQPILTPLESAQVLFTFDTFVRACYEAKLTFFILEASLMGVIRHHGLIPWDDDIDVVMAAKQWKKIRNVLANIEGFELYTPADSQWKFYMHSAASFPDKYFKFPNLDIFFYDEDETHIWSLTKGLKHDLVYRKSDIFPLQLRPFEHLMVPVPCNLDLVVHKTHNKHVCVTPEYIHKTNKNLYFGGTKSIQCRELYHVYPFVFPEKLKCTGYAGEFLKVGAQVIHKKVVPSTSCMRVADLPDPCSF